MFELFGIFGPETMIIDSDSLGDVPKGFQEGQRCAAVQVKQTQLLIANHQLHGGSGEWIDGWSRGVQQNWHKRK